MRLAISILLVISTASVSACSDGADAPDGGSDAGADAAGDSGGDGGPDGSSDSGGGDGGSTTPYELATLDEECEGLTGQQILDIAGGSHTVPFHYVVGGAADTELTLTFTYTDGTITCQPSITQPPGVGAPDLPAHVEIVVDATAATADGAFDEAGPATLQLMGFGTGSVLHNFDFDAASLGGTYAPTDPSLVDRVRFGGTIYETGLQGTAYEDGRSAGGAMTVAPIGNWDTVPTP